MITAKNEISMATPKSPKLSCVVYLFFMLIAHVGKLFLEGPPPLRIFAKGPPLQIGHIKWTYQKNRKVMHKSHVWRPPSKNPQTPCPPKNPQQ